MIVEVIGLPAVGKTTLIESNPGIIEEKLRVISSRKHNLVNSVLTRLYYHMMYKHLTNDELLARKISYRMSFRTFLARSKRYFFFDSGIYQVLIESLIDNNFSNIEDIQKILKKIRHPCKVIYIKESVDAIVDREMSRTKRRFDIDQEELVNRYNVLEDMIEKKVLFSHSNMYIVTASEFMQMMDVIGDD